MTVTLMLLLEHCVLFINSLQLVFPGQLHSPRKVITSKKMNAIPTIMLNHPMDLKWLIGSCKMTTAAPVKTNIVGRNNCRESQKMKLSDYL